MSKPTADSSGFEIRRWLSYMRDLGPGCVFARIVLCIGLFAGVVSAEAQIRNRSVVAWGETLLGLNRPPEFPAGTTPSDAESVVAGEFTAGVSLRAGILVGGTNYAGNRLVLRGPALLTGGNEGTVTHGSGTEDYTDRTSWNAALPDAGGRMILERVSFGHLFGAVVRKPTNSPAPLAAGRFKGQFPGDLAFFGDGSSAGLPVTDADPLGGFVAVSASSTHVLALRADGSVKAFGGDNLFGERWVPSGVLGAVEVAAGEFFSAALLSNGQVVVWGSDAWGVVGVPAQATNVVSLKAGASHLVALRADGTVVAWGNPADGRTAVPAGLNRVTKIAVGRAHALALREDGTVVAWGYNGAGQTTVPAGLVNVVDIAAGGQHNLALVSREAPVLLPITVRETGGGDPRDFEPALDFTDRGRTLTFRADLQYGAPPVLYRWRRNGAVVPGATQSQCTLVVPASESATFRIDVEAINAFGSDLRSVTVRIADSPSEVSVEAVAFQPTPVPSASVLGRNASGTILAVANPGQQLGFTVRAKGNPVPFVNVYDARTGESVATANVPVTNATASARGTSTVATLRPLSVANTGNYLVVVGNSLGKAVTNTVSVGIHPELSAPVVTSTFAPNATVPSFLGPVPPGSTNMVFSVVSSHGPAVSYQWSRDGVEIARATNSSLALTNFSFPQIGAYTVRIHNPLSGSTLPADRVLGTSISAPFTPVLPVTVSLSRTNLSGAAGTAAGLDIQLSGALHARAQLQRWEDGLGWSDASAWFPVVAPPLPAAWSAGGTFETDISGAGGRASFSIGVTSLVPSMTGSYRIRVVQLASPGGVELAGTEQTAGFTVAVTSAAALSVPLVSPPAEEGGGTWVSGPSPGVDMTVSAQAYSTVDLSAYLSVSGFPAPVFRWERQVSGASGGAPVRFQPVSTPTNSPRFTVAAHATNAGIYRVVATNAVSGTNGVSRIVALRVDRVLSMPAETRLAPGGAVEIPMSLVGFGDESAVSFTFSCPTPYLLTDPSAVAVNLDPTLDSSTTLSVRRSGTVSAPPANGGVGGNELRLQVLISRKDPSQGFPRGTNRIARLSIQAQTAEAIGIIRNPGTSGVTEIPPLRMPVRILTDAELVSSNRDLAFRVAYTNATQAPLVVDGGGIAVLADSVEGDVNGSGSVDVLDITSIASQLASSLVDTQSLARMRMDCAPRSESGDWSINLADLVQVARYVARLDALQPAADPESGGPGYSLNRSGRGISPKSFPKSLPQEPTRAISFGSSDLVAGDEAWVPLLLEGVGNENAFSFNLAFDSRQLEFVDLRVPGDTSFLVNRTGASDGRVGMVLWKQPGTGAPAGVSRLVEAGFRVRSQSGETELAFGSTPLDSVIATVDAKAVSRVRFIPKKFTIGQRRRVFGGRVVGQSLTGSEWRLELAPVDSSGKVVSARNRRLRVHRADDLWTPAERWQDIGLDPEVTPTGNVRIPVTLDSHRPSAFFRLIEE